MSLAGSLAGCSAPATEPERGTRYISLGADAVETARAVAGARGQDLEILETNGDVAVLAFDAEHLEELSEQMHERHDRCGGFMLHESSDEAMTALLPQRSSETRGGPIVDYTLDGGEDVHRVLASLDQAQILHTIRELSTNQNRYYRSPSGAATSIWLRDLWRSFTTRDDVTVELFDHGYAQQSVILTIPGRDGGPTRANEVIVLGGHLDSIARGGVDSVAPGADDDASGIATITEVARVLLAHDFRPTRTVKIMAYAAEEVGLRGSLAIVKDHKQRKINVVGVMQLDMTNFQGSDKDIWLMRDYTNAAQNTFVGQLIERYVGATWGYDACGYACSDHASWHRAGVPATMAFESRMKQRNPVIHTAKDTLEMSGNNATHALKFAKLAAAFAVELGGGTVGPSVTMATPADDAGESGRGWWRWIAAALAIGFVVRLLLRRTRR